MRNPIYTDALVLTDKQTRHQAVEIGAKKARANQRALARFIRRLAVRLERRFPGATVKVTHTQGVAARQRLANSGGYPVTATLWLMKDGKVIRSLIVRHAFADFCEVFVESSVYARTESPWNEGKDTLLEVPAKSRTDKAFNAAIKTPFIQYENS